ncbi:raftlin-like [Arapaima gigas]
MRHITPGRGSSVRTSAALRAPSARAVLAKPNVELIRISGRRVVTASSAVGGGLFPGPDLRVWICFELPDDTLLPDVLCFVDSSSKPAACFGRETLLSPLNRCGTTTGEMGCRLPKLKRSDENSPGKIYSTLKRPQVETKVGLAYTYRFLDFILGKDDGTSMLCISSVRELPGQMLELYQQGFVLAAVHPFVHPSGAEAASAQRMLYRAVLVRLSDSVDRPEAKSDNRLEMEVCLSASQVPGTELIQGYVKRIQDAAEQGIAFVGFVQQPSRAFSVLGQEDPDDLSMSLHSSPSSVQGSKAEQNQDPERQSPLDQQDGQTRDCEFEEALLNEAQAGSAGDGEEELPKGQVSSPPNVLPPAEDPPLEITDNSITPDNNNKATGQDSTKDKESGSSVLRRASPQRRRRSKPEQGFISLLVLRVYEGRCWAVEVQNVYVCVEATAYGVSVGETDLKRNPRQRIRICLCERNFPRGNGSYLPQDKPLFVSPRGARASPLLTLQTVRMKLTKKEGQAPRRVYKGNVRSAPHPTRARNSRVAPAEGEAADGLEVSRKVESGCDSRLR